MPNTWLLTTFCTVTFERQFTVWRMSYQRQQESSLHAFFICGRSWLLAPGYLHTPIGNDYLSQTILLFSPINHLFPFCCFFRTSHGRSCFLLVRTSASCFYRQGLRADLIGFIYRFAFFKKNFVPASRGQNRQSTAEKVLQRCLVRQPRWRSRSMKS